MTAVKLTDVESGESWIIDTRLRMWERDHWVTPDGTGRVEFSAMDDRHIGNVVAWLRRRPRKLHEDAINTMMRWGSGPLAPGGDVACDAFDQEFEALLEAEPREWLEGTPVMRGLKGELLLRHEPWLVDHDEREAIERERERRARIEWEADRDFRAYYAARRSGGYV